MDVEVSDITGDYRAIYEEINKGDDVFAFSITIWHIIKNYSKKDN